METVKVLRDEEFSDRRFYKVSPFKTDKIALSIYDFEPWQTMPMHRNPRNDTVLYVVQGQGTAFINDDRYPVNPNTAIYITANSTYGILAGENDMIVISVQGPTPVESNFDSDLSFSCPVCQLEAPVTTKAYDGCTMACPRCNTGLKLTKEAEGFKASAMSEPHLTGAAEEATSGNEMEQAREEEAVPGEELAYAKMDVNILDFAPWQALPMNRSQGSDTMLYIVQGQGIMFVNDEELSVDSSMAVYVPASSAFGVLAAEDGMIAVAVQGPTPVEVEVDRSLEYECPVCRTETPVTTNTFSDCITVCPRCNIKLKLTKEAEGFSAEETTEKTPAEAEAQ